MPEKSGSGLSPSGFGPELRRIREEKGLTQKQLGEVAGVHPNTVAKMERSEIEPSWPMVLALAKSLGVDCTAFSGSLPAPINEAPEPTSAKPVTAKVNKKRGKK